MPRESSRFLWGFKRFAWVSNIWNSMGILIFRSSFFSFAFVCILNKKRIFRISVKQSCIVYSMKICLKSSYHQISCMNQVSYISQLSRIQSICRVFMGRTIHLKCDRFDDNDFICVFFFFHNRMLTLAKSQDENLIELDLKYSLLTQEWITKFLCRCRGAERFRLPTDRHPLGFGRSGLSVE